MRPTVTFQGVDHYWPVTDTELYCLKIQACVCEQFAQGCYSKVERPLETGTLESQVHLLHVVLYKYAFWSD